MPWGFRCWKGSHVVWRAASKAVKGWSPVQVRLLSLPLVVLRRGGGGGCLVLRRSALVMGVRFVLLGGLTARSTRRRGRCRRRRGRRSE